MILKDTILQNLNSKQKRNNNKLNFYNLHPDNIAGILFTFAF